MIGSTGLNFIFNHAGELTLLDIEPAEFDTDEMDHKAAGQSAG
ncbi:hypothetical protein [Longimicrobium sp.]